ncbi:MAG: hypothetical protein JNM28_00405 [Armatimonadetes bacterium]|nr:hypothetical protein [Armatimonadota bacterium]MBS1711346.1 hypothetical protein [Armatimonadota bacterium]MBX3107729.1 hypothetical protein [Fimbriimonadaceae bacterium]
MNRVFLIALACLGASVAWGEGFGPTPYLQASDSPWNSYTWSYHHLEDFEDNLLNVPGVTVDHGNPYSNPANCDSVDADDGTIDGSGLLGHSLFYTSGSTGVKFTFDANALGQLPNYAGIVWTDGGGATTFTAFDANGVQIGQIIATTADGASNGQTAEDRFYGWHSDAGIGSIHIKNASGGIEVDHLQYGLGQPVPEPATFSAAALLGLLARRKKNRSN